VEIDAAQHADKLVLVVDDDPDIRSTIREILEDEGYCVLDAANGLEALGRLRGERAPDLILLDLSMPVMSGAEFRTEQRKDPALSSIPVVVVTAVGSPDVKVSPLEVDAFLRKPVELEELLGTVERFCR
jgi:CheY-like chemotaxis protein